MIDRHAVHALLKAGRATKEIAQQFGVTRRTIQRIAKEPPVDDADDGRVRRRRGVGRPAIVHHCHIVTIRGNSYRMRHHSELWQALHSAPEPEPPSTRHRRNRSEASTP